MVETTISSVMNCFVAGFTQMTSIPTIPLVLYILSEYVWEKPNNKNI
jgi:hypothetical protein